MRFASVVWKDLGSATHLLTALNLFLITINYKYFCCYCQLLLLHLLLLLHCLYSKLVVIFFPCATCFGMTASHMRQAPARPSRMNAGGPELQVYCNFHVERTSRVCNLQCAARFPQVETCPCTSWQELNTRRTCATGSSTLLISISRTGLHLQVTAQHETCSCTFHVRY